MSLLHRITVSRRLGGLVTLAVLLILSIALGLSYSERNMLTQERQSAVRQTVEVAHGILALYHEQAIKGEISQEQAQRSALQAISRLRYSGSE